MKAVIAMYRSGLKSLAGKLVLLAVLIGLAACNDNTELVDIVEDGEEGVVALKASNDSIQLAAGQSYTLSASADFDDGSESVFNDDIRWISRDETIATVSSDGTVTAVSEGQTSISYHWRRISGTTEVTVSAAALNAINFSSTLIEEQACSEITISATGLYSDGTVQALPTGSVWSSDNEGTLVVQAQQGNTADLLLLDSGTANLTLNNGSVTATVPVTATATLADLRFDNLSNDTIANNSATLTTGADFALQLTAVHADDTEQDIDHFAQRILAVTDDNPVGAANGIVLDTHPDTGTDTTSDTSTTDNPPAGAEPGSEEEIIESTSAFEIIQGEDDTLLLRGKQPGGGTISVTCGGLTTTMIVEVIEPPPLSSISIAETTESVAGEAEADLEPDQTLTPSVIAHYSDGSTQPATDNIQWTVVSGDIDSFTVDLTSGAVTANADTVAEQSIVLRAVVDTATADVRIVSNRGVVETVSSTQLFYVDQSGLTLPLTTTQSALSIGDTLQLTLKTVYNTGREEFSLSNLFWSNLNPDIASIDGSGLLTAHAPGTTSIFAIREGEFTSFQFTVDNQTTASSTTTQYKLLTIPVPDMAPANLGWADSYSYQNKCYISSDLDHDADQITIGGMSTADIQNTQNAPGIEFADALYNDINCGNGPPNNAGDEDWCPGRVDLGAAGCLIAGPDIADQLP